MVGFIVGDGDLNRWYQRVVDACDSLQASSFHLRIVEWGYIFIIEPCNESICGHFFQTFLFIVNYRRRRIDSVVVFICARFQIIPVAGLKADIFPA